MIAEAHWATSAVCALASVMELFDLNVLNICIADLAISVMITIQVNSLSDKD